MIDSPVERNPEVVTPSRIIYEPIGIIRSGHKNPDNAPIQSVYAKGCRGQVEIFPEYAGGLRDLEGFSHIYLLYDFHLARSAGLSVKPFLQDVERGVFATRAPGRPNRIGLSIVKLLFREDNTLHVDWLDMLDASPVLDIKPYVGRFDRIEHTYDGWHDGISEETARQRGRRGATGDDE
jgi:tRNA (adenine37-N6)-methyltransferase